MCHEVFLEKIGDGEGIIANEDDNFSLSFSYPEVAGLPLAFILLGEEDGLNRGIRN